MRNKGNSLIQYAIILALLGLVTAPMFSGLGQTVVQCFQDYTNVWTNSNQTLSSNVEETLNATAVAQNTTLQSTYKPAVLPETDIKPSCSNGTCQIDIGGVSINGIPENFNTLVETSGAAGGTEKIATILMSLAENLEDQGFSSESEEIKKLAVYGHNIAVIEKEFENIINACNYDGECVENFKNNFNYVPTGYDETYGSFPLSDKKFYLNKTITIGEAYKNKQNNLPTFNNLKNAGYTSYLFIDQLDTILESSTLSDEAKGVVKELSWDIGIIGEDFQNNICFVSGYQENECLKTYDPFTGESIPSDVTSADKEPLKNYKASKITHFDSSLICAASNYSDNGVKCH